eukprot:SAG22_NODE_7774_length_709_cov_1.598361_1_plen_25_part_10
MRVAGWVVRADYSESVTLQTKYVES